MLMRETGQIYQKNLLKALSNEFSLKIPCKTQISGEKLIYKNNQWLELKEYSVKGKNNSSNDFFYYKINRPSFTQVILVNNFNELCFQLRYRLGCNNYVIDFPGGSIEKDETPILAAKRELKEELGITNINLIEIGNCYMDPMRSNFKGYFYKSNYFGKINSFTSYVNGELEESMFVWMNKTHIRKYFDLLPSSSITALHLMNFLQFNN